MYKDYVNMSIDELTNEMNRDFNNISIEELNNELREINKAINTCNSWIDNNSAGAPLPKTMKILEKCESLKILRSSIECIVNAKKIVDSGDSSSNENTSVSSENIITQDSVDIPDEVITDDCLEKYFGAKHINLKNAKKFDENFLGFGIFTDVESIYLPPSIEVIPASCFMSCVNLKQINLENVKKIESCAFDDCTSLQKIDLRNAIKIESMAFKGCINLETVYIN